MCKLTLYLLLFFVIILFLLAFLFSDRDIMAPSVMVCVMFMISTVFAIASQKDYDTPFSLEACLIIASGIAVFIIAEVLFHILLLQKGRSGYKQVCTLLAQERRHLYVQQWMVWALLIFDIVVMIAYINTIVRITRGSWLNISKVFSTYRGLTANIASSVDAEVETVPIYLNISKMIVLAGGYISTYIVIYNLIWGKKIKKQAGLLVTAVIGVLSTFLGAGRNGFLQYISFLLVIYYILWHKKYGWNKNLSWKYIRVGLLCIIVGVPSFYYILPLLGRDKNMVGGALRYAAFYVGNPLRLFSLFLESHTAPRVFGEECFVGVYRFLKKFGLSEFARNTNLEFSYYHGVNLGNVYTWFRRPLHDFGLAGMYVFMILLAFFFSWMYYGKIKGSQATKGSQYWTLFYGYFYYWIVASSTVQRSESYLSSGTFLIVAAILLGFKIMTSVRVVFGAKRKSHVPVYPQAY